MRLGFISESTNNAFYRAVFPMRAMARRGHTVLWPARLEDDVPMRELLTCDLVHCYRRTDRLDDLARLVEHGVAVTFDNDDNFATAVVSDGGHGLAGRQYNMSLYRDMLKAAQASHLVTTPSSVLADAYRAAGVQNVAVIENHLDGKMLGFGARSRHDGVVVGWVAGREHKVDLERIPIAKALERLLALHVDLRILTVGLRLPMRAERYEHLTSVPLPNLLKVTSRIDIGLAPLSDIAFNRSRSNVKLKEYSSGGASWLASPVGPYLGLGDKQGGVLVEDQEWFAALDELIRHPRRRRRLARRALRWARRQAIDGHAGRWEGAFADTVERVRAARTEFRAEGGEPANR